jgi:hypothetical protein
MEFVVSGNLGNKFERPTSSQPLLKLFFNFLYFPAEEMALKSQEFSMIVDAPWYVPNTVSEGISKYQQLKMKSAATALNTVLASAQIQMIWLPDF